METNKNRSKRLVELHHKKWTARLWQTCWCCGETGHWNAKCALRRETCLPAPARWGRCVDCTSENRAITLDSETTKDKEENNHRLSCVVWWPVVALGLELCWRLRSRTWWVVMRKNESLWKECVWVCEIHRRSEGHKQNIPALLTRQRRGT